MKGILLTFVLALAMGCATPPPLPTATPKPFIARQLDVKIDPKDAATYLLNPGVSCCIDTTARHAHTADRYGTAADE